MLSMTNFFLCHCTDPSIWKWADGSQLNYTNWVPGFPVTIRNDCVQLEWSRFNSTKWYNTPCKAKRHFICQAPKGIPRISYSLFSRTSSKDKINEACIKYTSFHLSFTACKHNTRVWETWCAPNNPYNI